MSPWSRWPRAPCQRGCVDSWSRVLSLRALLDASYVRVRRVHRHQLAHHAIRPAEAVLQGIFPAAADAPRHEHVVLLDQLAALGVDVVHVEHPATGDHLRELALAVLGEPGNADPL